MAAPLGRRVDHPVGGRFQHIVGQPLQHVADIDGELAGLGRDRQPVAVAVEQLQPRFLGAEQQGDGVDVLVRAGADVGAVAGDRRIMEQAQDRIAVLHRVDEIIGREAEIAGDRLEDA